MIRTHWRALPHNSPAPMSGGCYAIFMDGALAYIGSSSCLARRFSNHCLWLNKAKNTYSTPWGQCAVLEIRVREARYWAEWATLELRLIHRLAPRNNKAKLRVRPAPYASEFNKLPIVRHTQPKSYRYINPDNVRYGT